MGGNCHKSAVMMAQFEDQQRGMTRGFKRNRKFDVHDWTSVQSETTDGTSIEDARVVLVTTGRTTAEASAHNFVVSEHNDDASAIMGSVALRCREHGQEKLIGGCYLFVDEQSADDFLASD